MKLLLDNSALSLLFCKRKFQLTVIQGLHEEADDVKAEGSVFHTLQEFMRKGFDIDEALEAAQKKHPLVQEFTKPLRAVTLYRGTTRLPEVMILNDKPAVEHKFLFKYGNFIVPNQAEPIEVYLCGTIDDLHHDEDVLVFLDYKYSGAFKPEHQDSVMESYLMSFQLPFYVWALYTSGTLPADDMERIKSGRYRSELHFIFTNVPKIRKQRRQAFPYDFLFKEVPHIVNAKISQAIEILTQSDAAPRDGMAVYNACKNCMYKVACMEVGTEQEVEYLGRFARRNYNPMDFR